MKRNRFVIRGKILPIAWSIILLGAVFILIKFAALSFSDNVGQANTSIKEAVMSRLCINVMESNSSFIRYSTKKEENTYSFPINLVAEEFVLHDFIKDNSLKTAMAQESSRSFNEAFLLDSQASKNAVINQADMKEYTNQLIGFHEISNEFLTKEYILTNGTLFGNGIGSNGLFNNSLNAVGGDNSFLDQFQVGLMVGDIDRLESEDKSLSKDLETMRTNNGTQFTMEQLKDVNFLVRNFYIVDHDTKVTESLFNAERMLNKDMTLKQKNNAPQILIYHTHSQEAFLDSRLDVEEDTVVGMGTYLTEILVEKYGYNVIHDKTSYDFVNRNVAYNYAREGIEKILEENPTIEVVIDLHRDGLDKRSTYINGEETAQIMLFNGLCRDQNGPLTRLDNPNLQDNLAFSLQLQMKSLELYPGLFYKNYLHCYRYNMHVRPKCILMELGTHKNTLKSAKNAMGPFAEILNEVLQKK